MIFLGIVLVLGLRTRQPRRYWYHAAVAVAIQLATGFMFGGGQGADGRPLTGLVGLASLALGWGLPIWLVYRGYDRKMRGASDGELESGARSDRSSS